jgi:hypothetical protein
LLPQLNRKLADEKKAVEFAKALNFDPSSLIKSVETTEVMMGRLAASVSGAKAVLGSRAKQYGG